MSQQAAKGTEQERAAPAAGEHQHTPRLIEQWLPIEALGEESVRERNFAKLPKLYVLHVWWARRPMVASRAAIAASLLPADADRDKFMHLLGIHGDPVEAKRLMDEAVRSGERIENPYGYSRAFTYTPSEREKRWLANHFPNGDQLVGVEDASVDAVVIDPPYYDNVMYAELSDFFYVWLKRTAGQLFPEQFSDYLTDKDREAVANPAKFQSFKQVKGSGGVQQRASRDYQERMQAIFTECRRVLKPDGVMTLMFTHKASGAWDALAKGLVDAGFEITASWPVRTEAEGSMHIKDKNAAKSTIFLVCRPRPETGEDGEPTWWEDIEPKVEEIVRSQVGGFQEVGIRGVDLYLAAFGPALQVFSEHWPMQRGRPAQKPQPAKGAQLKLAEDEEWDPYAVRPEDALNAARNAVKDWRLQQLAAVQRRSHVDPLTEWFVLAWDAFKAAEFPADEALKLARVVGVNFDAQLRGRLLEVKGSDVILWDSAMRAKKGVLGSATGEVLIDSLHHVANTIRSKNLETGKRTVETADLEQDPNWKTALEYVLNVLPTPSAAGASKTSPLGGAAQDGAALEQLRRLMFENDVPQSEAWRGLFGQAE